MFCTRGVCLDLLCLLHLLKTVIVINVGLYNTFTTDMSNEIPTAAVKAIKHAETINFTVGR